MPIIFDATTPYRPMAGRFQVSLIGGAMTVQTAPMVAPDAAPTWIGLLSLSGAAVTGNGATFTIEIGHDHWVRVTGPGQVLFGRIPAAMTNVA